MKKLEMLPCLIREIKIYSNRPGVSKWFFPSNFSTKILYAFLISPIRTTCPSNL